MAKKIRKKQDEIHLYDKIKGTDGKWKILLPCMYHGSKQALMPTNFYMANEGSIYRGFGLIPICKDCINDKMYMEYFSKFQDHKKSIYFTCRRLDVPFLDSLATSAIESLNNYGGVSAFGYYMRNFIVGYTNKGVPMCFDDGEILGSSGTTSEDILRKIESEIRMTSDDRENKNKVISILGYDPFEGTADSDKKFLFNDLANFLRDDIINDPMKLGDIIQYVNNNHQIRKLDLYTNVMMRSLDVVQDDGVALGRIVQQKKDLSKNNNEIAKKDWLRDSESAKQSKLGFKIQKLKSLEFDEAEVSYFDQKTCEAMKKVVDISNKSILDQIDLNDTDMKEMFAQQRKMIEEFQFLAEKYENELVDARREISKLKMRFGIQDE